MAYGRGSTRRQDITSLGSMQYIIQDIISLVPVMAYGRGSTRRQDIASLGYVQYIRQDIAKAWCHFW